MPGTDAFANPFDASRNGVGPNRNPSAIGTGRGRASSSSANHVDGHSPTAHSNSTSSWSENHAIRMRRLPETATRDTVRSMLLFSTDFLGAEFIQTSRDENPYQTALARFRSSEGALQAVQALNGKQAGEDGPDMLVELVTLSPGGSVSARRFPDGSPTENGAHRQGSRFSETFRDMDQIPPSQSGNGTLNGGLVNGVSPTFRSAHTGNNGSFGGQSQIGHPLERQHISGRSMIQEDGADDETDLIMQDPGSFMTADRQMHFMQQGRRATAPNISLTSRLAGLSVNSNVGPSVSPLDMASGVTSPRGQSGYQSPGSTPFSPPGMNGIGTYGNNFSNATSPTSSQWQPFQRSYQTLPPVNPADQNPPCNTLYVGNLPMDTSEDELKNLFSKVRGYRRLCFRMKSNGPMCFVEFEDIGHATRALKEHYGTMLSNSVRGGIRLSFSKNPLGVRGPATQSPISPSNGHGNGSNSVNFGGPLGSAYTSMNNQGFSTASGPPPGLPAPQGFSQGSQRKGSIAGPANGSVNGSHTPTHQNHSSLGNGFQPPGFADTGRFAQYTR